ncbi:MAG: hypothetical protein GY754_32810 [bacterium]|nr:hypothetical protein [bacterium]
MSLKPVTCPGCSGPVPLIEADTTSCPYCKTEVDIPDEYEKAVRASRASSEARKAMEPLWSRVSREAPKRSLIAALVLTALLPPIATLLANIIPYPPMNQLMILAAFSFPSILPGAGIWIWSVAINATTARFKQALSARPPQKIRGNEGPPCCRSCGAPLTVEKDALSATCVYCNTDSILEIIPVDDLVREAGSAIQTLEQASRLLRRRRYMIGLGTIGTVLLIASLIVIVITAVVVTS